MLILASGLWVLLLAGCAVFAVLAQRQKRRADRAEHELLTLGNNAPDQPAVGVGTSELQSTASMGDMDDLRFDYDALAEKYSETLSVNERIRQELSVLEVKSAKQQGSAASLQVERDMLDRQLKNLSAGLDAGDPDTMREMIVNFTEESRELLAAIEELGKEKAELNQKIADMEAAGMGTAGAVVGLKRMLSEAEEEIQQLKRGAR